MKVVYDISTLGIAQRYPFGRAGTARVAESIASELANSNECNLIFYPGMTLGLADACREYLDSHPQVKDVPLLYSNFRSIRRFIRNERYDPDVVNAPSFKELLAGRNLNVVRQESKLRKRLWRRLAIYGDHFVAANLHREDRNALTQADIFHSPFSPVPMEVRQIKGVQKFLTIYDLLTILKPEFFDSYIIRHTQTILDSLSKRDWVIAISHATKKDLCDYRKIDPARVFVTHLAASPEVFFPNHNPEQIAAVRKRYGIPEGKYFLTLNKLEPRKNIDMVIRCFARLIQEEHIKDCSLVLAGDRGWLYGKIFDEISRHEAIRDRIVVTGYVPDEDLSALYSDSLVFIYPSFYEGFGLPPLEAMQCGVPVVTSNTSALPEVVGDAGIMIDPTDADALCQSMNELYRNDSLRDELSASSLERAKQFSWSKCIQETIAAYKTALAS